MSAATTQNNNLYLKPKYSRENTPQEHHDSGMLARKRHSLEKAKQATKDQETPAHESVESQIEKSAEGRKAKGAGQKKAMLLVIHIGKG